MKRLIRALAAVAVLAAVFAAGAYALAFSDNDYFWPDGTVGETYLKELHPRSDCPPFKFDLIAGQLPPGLHLESRGVVTGVPTQLGEWSFWLRVRDCQNMSAEREFSIKVNHVRLTVTTTTLPVAIHNVAYSQAIGVVGGGATKRWSVASGSLPAGVTLNPDGTITGTPTATGDFVFVARVTDENNSTDTKQLLLRVVEPLAVAQPAVRARLGEVGRPFRAALAATGGTQPYTWALTGSLPAGLTFDAASGVLSGVPEEALSTPLSIVVTDANKLTQTLSLRLVVVNAVSVSTAALPSAAAGARYAVRLAARGGVRPLRWDTAGGRLPRGLVLGRATGRLAGVPRTPGTYRLRVRVTDALGARSARPLVLVVRA